MNSIPALAGRKVLLTGAAGCIGAWAVKLLRDMDAIPVVFDITDNRERLDFIMPDADKVIWEIGDITDYDQLLRTVDRYDVTAIIHLAALQVPFCKADPVKSAAINVMGSTHILECARQTGIKRLAYASSIAAPAMGDSSWLSTLYGAHKVCAEQMASVYWQDWQVPSVGIRPAIIYGPGRDQGMSSAPTVAMLAAQCRRPYHIPFGGEVSYVHAEDAAIRFIAAVGRKGEGAPVFDLNGTPADINELLDLIRACIADAELTHSKEPLPFPATPDDGQLNAYLNVAPCRPLKQGIGDTLACFEAAQAKGTDLPELLERTMGKTG